MPAIGRSVGGYVALGCPNTKAIGAVFEGLDCGQFKALDICGTLIFNGRSPFYVNSRICGMSRRLERGCRGFASRSDNVSEVPSVVAEIGDTMRKETARAPSGRPALSQHSDWMSILAGADEKIQEYETPKVVDVINSAHFGIKFS
ncbi:uncharacterized protein ARMOST_19021 [Armillaria ostoyae]|uniref:Uncharacterized protein n=1 Tax=Armillaria ostoyae TaxID=47428 RepID=A0A284S3D7_ARMOS|nr:uncharacterized protein ARMOST_19021 [Armillaria ostoyae]